jgi:RNA polymerase sigma-70 factor (ECF subfamily)
VESSPESPGEELIQRAMAGNAEAFGDLYLACLDRVYRYVFYRVRDARLAEDLTETTFLRAWEARRRYHSGKVPVIGWFYRIAHNAVIDHFRTSHHEQDLTPSLPTPEADLEGRMAEMDETNALSAALRELDPTSQEVLSLRFGAGLSHAEVAQLLGRSSQAVRVIQFRALRRLRGLMRGRQSDEG